MNNLPYYIIEDLNGPYFAWKPAQDEPVRPSITCLSYLNLGKRRTYRQIADFYKISVKTVERYALKYNWKKRAYLFDKMIYRLTQNKSYIEWEKQQEAIFNLKLQYSAVARENATEILGMLQFNDVKYKDERTMERLEFIKKATFTMKNIFKITDFKPPDLILARNAAINAVIAKEFDIKDTSQLHNEKNYIYNNMELKNYDPDLTMDNLCDKCRQQNNPSSTKSICRAKINEIISDFVPPDDDESLDNLSFYVLSDDPESFYNPSSDDTPSEPEEQSEIIQPVETTDPMPDTPEPTHEHYEPEDIHHWRDPATRDHSNDPDDDPAMVAALDEDYNRYVLNPEDIPY